MSETLLKCQEAVSHLNHAQSDLREAKKALKKWKEDHEEEGFSPLNDELQALEKRVNDANQRLNDAERRWKDARAVADILSERARRTARVSLSTLNSRIKSLYSFAFKLSVDLPDEHCDEFKYLEDWKVEERLMVAFFAQLKAKEIKCLILDEAQKNLELVEFLVKSPGADRLGLSYLVLRLVEQIMLIMVEVSEQEPLLWLSVHLGDISSCFSEFQACAGSISGQFSMESLDSISKLLHY